MDEVGDCPYVAGDAKQYDTNGNGLLELGDGLGGLAGPGGAGPKEAEQQVPG